MNVTLRYGAGTREIEIVTPGGGTPQVDVLDTPGLPALPDFLGALRAVCAKPVGGRSLGETVKGRANALLLLSDRTRRAAYPLILPPFLDELNAAGIPDDRITALVAYGTHAPQSDAESEESYGEAFLKRVKLFHHDARDPGGLTRLGTTRRGTPVELNRRLLDADLVLAVGSVMFHYFAGFGGGPKMIFPGCASVAGVRANHRLFLDPEHGTHPGCAPGRLSGNPVAEDIAEAAALRPADFGVQVLLARDGTPADVMAGSLVEAHREASDRLLRTAVPARPEYDLVVVSCGGRPRDLNWIQAHKALDAACRFARPGGSLVLLAECMAGMGSATFLDWFRPETLRETVQQALAAYTENAGTAVACRRKAESFQIEVATELRPEIVEQMGFAIFDDDRIETEGRVLVLPNAGALGVAG